jgi:purine-nucleoside phosphorylase
MIEARVPAEQVEAYFYGKPKVIGTKILFIKRANRLDEYKEYLTGVQEFGHVWQGASGLLAGERVTVISTGIGPSLVGDAVYALNRPDAVCLYSGTCGGLAADLEIGDYLIADRAVCGDGYSFHLGHDPLSQVSASRELLDSLTALLDSKVERMSRGTTFTTGSVVREVEPDFWSAVDEQCRAIDMGAGPFYAAAQATGKRAIAYFWVTDLPLSGKSFFEVLDAEDVHAKQARYDRAVSLDIELLAGL